ncbi:MAG: serine/threonine-protein kinase [Acidobacteriota bacterium]
MDVERERRWNALLVAALEVEPPQRAVRLAELEPDDATLVGEVLASLESNAELDGFLEPPSAVAADRGETHEALTVPRHRLLERIGSGGMGDVFRAEQQEPVRRPVALKCIQAHLPDEARVRFLSEREALARLDHRNIARFYDAGTTDDGRPWLSMELLEGLPLTRYCDRHRLSVEARIRLFLEVCAGLEHAHRRQILHRDLKPSNVLVAEGDGRPTPKIIDFGIAKLLDAAPELRTRATRAGTPGTPAYMSPEALTGIGAVDTRTDVYSLGVLLYELLVGQRPFDSDAPALGELVRRVREDEPEDPATCLRALTSDEQAAVARHRGTSKAALARDLESDLRWILGKALEKDPDRRYGSVRELGEDLERALGHEPIQARSPSTLYRLSKLVRRRRSAVVAALIALIGLGAGAVGLTLGLLRARDEAESARTALLEARAVSEFLIGLFQGADPTAEDGTDLSVRELLDRGADGIRDRLADYPAARGRLLNTLADVYMERGNLDRAETMLREATTLLDAALPPGDPERASVLGSLGVFYVHRRDWPEAETAFARAVAALDPESEPEDWALKRHNLGVAVFRQGRLDEAEEHYLAALELRQRVLPPDHPHLARSYNALGGLMLSRGQHADAEGYFEAAVEHGERTLSPEHPDLAKALVNVGRALHLQGRSPEAREHVERALRIEEAALGSEHPDLLWTLNNLATIAAATGDHETAVAARSHKIRIRQSSGDTGLQLKSDLIWLAYHLLETDRLEAAETYLQQANEILEREPDPRDPDKTIPRLGLATVAWKRGQLDLAEREAAAVLTAREAFSGRGAWVPGSSLRVLAGVAHERGDAERAAAHARRLLEIWRETPPSPTWWTRLLQQEMERLIEAAP